MKRTCSRIIAMQIIYNYNINKVLDFMGIVDIVDEEEVEYDVNYLKQIVNGVVDNQSQIDFMISMNLKNYTLDRLSVVDRSLLEIGTYELLFTSTPTNIVINEIVEISKEYSEVDDYKTSKFNNAVLDSIAKSRK
jgi:N utilization substance protein B